MMDHIEIGRISGPHGLKGLIKFIPYGNSFKTFKTYSHVIIDKDSTPLKVIDAKERRNYYIIQLEGITHISQVEPLKGKSLFIRHDQLEELSEDEYYWRDIIGLKIIGLDGNVFGEVVNIFSNGSNDVYVVDKIKQLYIPATKDVIKEINVDTGIISIDASLLEGLLD